MRRVRRCDHRVARRSRRSTNARRRHGHAERGAASASTAFRAALRQRTNAADRTAGGARDASHALDAIDSRSSVRAVDVVAPTVLDADSRRHARDLHLRRRPPIRRVSGRRTSAAGTVDIVAAAVAAPAPTRAAVTSASGTTLIERGGFRAPSAINRGGRGPPAAPGARRVGERRATNQSVPGQ